MKINFTKREYRTLIELLYLGQWLLTAHDVGEQPEKARFEQLVQKLYAFHREMGCEDWLNANRGSVHPTRAFEEAMQSYVDDFVEPTFWEELPSRLALRDAEREVGREQLGEMDGYARMQLIADKEEPWFDEFETHGIDRLVVDPSAGT